MDCTGDVLDFAGESKGALGIDSLKAGMDYYGDNGPNGDEAALQIIFTSRSTATVSFNYVFASRELPEYTPKRLTRLKSMPRTGRCKIALAISTATTLAPLAPRPLRACYNPYGPCC